MANILGDAFSGIGTWSSASFWNIIFAVAIIFLTLVVLGGVAFFLYWKSFKYNVYIYRPFGQKSLSDKELGEIKKEGIKGVKERKIAFDNLRTKKTHGKYVKVKGTPFFALFSPFKKIESVPLERLYDNGIHLLQLSQDLFIPIEKPNTSLEVGENISLSIKENDRWITWNNMMADKINRRYPDVEAQKRTTLYVIVGLVLITILGCTMLYLVYRASTRGIDVGQDVANALNNVGGGVRPQ